MSQSGTSNLSSTLQAVKIIVINIKIGIKYQLIHQIYINCVGVQTFENLESKFKNVEKFTRSKSHICN